MGRAWEARRSAHAQVRKRRERGEAIFEELIEMVQTTILEGWKKIMDTVGEECSTILSRKEDSRARPDVACLQAYPE
jgi:hypothetical protein